MRSVGDFDLAPECMKMSRGERGAALKVTDGRTESLGLETGTGERGRCGDSEDARSPVLNIVLDKFDLLLLVFQTWM